MSFPKFLVVSPGEVDELSADSGPATEKAAQESAENMALECDCEIAVYRLVGAAEVERTTIFNKAGAK